jgi:hypothetical protein
MQAMARVTVLAGTILVNDLQYPDGTPAFCGPVLIEGTAAPGGRIIERRCFRYQGNVLMFRDALGDDRVAPAGPEIIEYVKV